MGSGTHAVRWCSSWACGTCPSRRAALEARRSHATVECLQALALELYFCFFIPIRGTFCARSEQGNNVRGNRAQSGSVQATENRKLLAMCQALCYTGNTTSSKTQPALSRCSPINNKEHTSHIEEIVERRKLVEICREGRSILGMVGF